MRFLNLTPKECFKQKKSAINFRITEDLFLSADETAEIDEANEELVATDLALVGAVPGAVDQIPFSYMDYLEGTFARCKTTENFIVFQMQELESPNHVQPAQTGFISTMGAILQQVL